MKVFTVHSTDEWETRTSEAQIGIFSTVEKARDCVKEVFNYNNEGKLVIEEAFIDEIDSGAKLEVYSFENGLEWKSDYSNAELGSLAMESLSN